MRLIWDQNSIQQVSHQQLHRMIQVDAMASFFHLKAQIGDMGSSSFTSNTVQESVLGKFPQIFETPSSLPPRRHIDHHIHLKQGVSPINVRPYRYPHF